MIIKWEEYKPEGDYIPVSRWGQDHWSTFAYLETCAVDNKGIVDNRRMRCNPRLHRELANMGTTGQAVDGSRYPTRLKDGEASKHDDWSCLEDMVSAGYLKAWFRVVEWGEVFGNTQARVELTPLGFEVAALLRQHKAGGGQYRNFEVEKVVSDGKKN